MPLESGTLIPDLNQNNPLGADPKSEGDDHLRLVKRCVQGSFAAFVGTTATPKSVSLTEDQINDAALKSEAQTVSGAWDFDGEATFNVAPRLLNDIPLNGRNAALDAVIPLIKLNASNQVEIGTTVAGLGSTQIKVPTGFSHQVFSGADELARFLPIVSGGMLVTDRLGFLKKAGFRNPSLQTFSSNRTLLQDDEGRVLQVTNNVPDLTIDQLEAFTTSTVIATGSACRILKGNVTNFRWLDGSGSLTVIATGVNVTEGSVVQIYYSSTVTMYVWGNGISEI